MLLIGEEDSLSLSLYSWHPRHTPQVLFIAKYRVGGGGGKWDPSHVTPHVIMLVNQVLYLVNYGWILSLGRAELLLFELAVHVPPTPLVLMPLKSTVCNVIMWIVYF